MNKIIAIIVTISILMLASCSNNPVDSNLPTDQFEQVAQTTALKVAIDNAASFKVIESDLFTSFTDKTTVATKVASDPSYQDEAVESYKVRVILKNGKVKEVKYDKMKPPKNGWFKNNWLKKIGFFGKGEVINPWVPSEGFSEPYLFDPSDSLSMIIFGQANCPFTDMVLNDRIGKLIEMQLEVLGISEATDYKDLDFNIVFVNFPFLQMAEYAARVGEAVYKADKKHGMDGYRYWVFMSELTQKYVTTESEILDLAVDILNKSPNGKKPKKVLLDMFWETLNSPESTEEVTSDYNFGSNGLPYGYIQGTPTIILYKESADGTYHVTWIEGVASTYIISDELTILRSK